MIVSLTPGQVCERGSLFHILRKAHGESHRQFDDRMKQMLEKTYVGCGVVAIVGDSLVLFRFAPLRGANELETHLNLFLARLSSSSREVCA